MACLKCISFDPSCFHGVSRLSSTLPHSPSTKLLFLQSSLLLPNLSLRSRNFRALSSPNQLSQELADDADDQAARNNALREAILNFVEEDLDSAATKYDLEGELFAKIDYAQINAFTDRPFAGNPAAVCYLPLQRDDQWLQLIAREFNLSETAFLIKRRLSKKRPLAQNRDVEQLNGSKGVNNANSWDIQNEFDLRWFTPKVEVDLCGHATLASAHLLFSSGIVEGDTVLFHTKSGILKARKVTGYDELEETEGSSDEDATREKSLPLGVGVVELDFPIVSATQCDDMEAKVLSEALGGVETLWVGRTDLGDYLVEISSSKEIRQLQPCFSKMMNFSGRGGVMVTASADTESEHDFVSRFFCPKAGIVEDPVTGSAHCTLGPYWAEKLGKTTLKAFQASERGGNVTMHINKSEGRTYLQGSAVLVMAGVLLNTMRA